MCPYQHRSYRSSSCPRSSPPGCRSTAELQEGSLPSSSVSLLPGPATMTADCHLQQWIQSDSQWPRQNSLMSASARARAQVGQGHGFYLQDCTDVASLAFKMQKKQNKYTVPGSELKDLQVSMLWVCYGYGQTESLFLGCFWDTRANNSSHQLFGAPQEDNHVSVTTSTCYFIYLTDSSKKNPPPIETLPSSASWLH